MRADAISPKLLGTWTLRSERSPTEEPLKLNEFAPGWSRGTRWLVFIPAISTGVIAVPRPQPPQEANLEMPSPCGAEARAVDRPRSTPVRQGG